MQPIALTGRTLAAACSFSSIIISAAVLAWAAQTASRCSARVQLVALTGVRLAAACRFSSLIISAAVLALGLGSTGRPTLLGECSSWPSA